MTSGSRYQTKIRSNYAFSVYPIKKKIKGFKKNPCVWGEKKKRHTATKFWKLENRCINNNKVFQLAEHKRPQASSGKHEKAELKAAPDSPRTGERGGWQLKQGG